MRGTQMARQWKIIQFIESHKSGISGTDLASKLDTPLRKDLAPDAFPSTMKSSPGSWDLGPPLK